MVIGEGVVLGEGVVIGEGIVIGEDIYDRRLVLRKSRLP
jgi:acetyltransferase-like isoleucine patch superfamily enzyme